MIAFGCAISEPEPWVRYAEPGIRLAAEPDSRIFAFAAVDTTARAYNLLLDAAAAHDDLEALVIVHPHAQIADPQLCAKVRERLRDPDVALVGCAGARGVGGLAWWEGELSCGPVTHRYTEHGGGELPAFSWVERRSAPPDDVDVLDEFLLVLSPWAVRSVGFDEALIPDHGYAVDYCLQVGAAGRKLQTAPIAVIEHRALELVGKLELWTESHVALAEKWEGRLPSFPPGDERRARRAEAEHEAARAITYFNRLELEARAKGLEDELARTTATWSWRATEPLRRINLWRRGRAPVEGREPRMRVVGRERQP